MAKFEIKEIDGKPHRYYPESGRLMVQSKEGRWVFAKGTEKHTFDSASGRGAALSRWESYREAAMRGLMKATKTKLPVEAVEALSEKFADLAMSGERGRAPYASHIMKLAGLTQEAELPPPAMKIEIDRDAALALLERIRASARRTEQTRYQQHEVIEAEFGEAEG